MKPDTLTNDRAFAVTPGRVYQIITDAAARAGIPAIRPHDLRRTYAKLSRAGGAPLEQIQVTLGHQSIKTTQCYLGTDLQLERGKGCGDYINIGIDTDKE